MSSRSLPKPARSSNARAASQGRWAFLRLSLALGACLPALAGCGGGSSQDSTAGFHSANSASSSSVRRAADVRNGTATPSVRRSHVPLLTLPADPVAHTVDVPILTWHRVAVFANEYTKSIPDETVEPSVFAAEIDALASHGYHPISQLQLFDALFHGAALPSRPVLLTVDDGYVDDVKTILPILQTHHFVATFYIITGRFREPGFLNQTEVRRLDAAGMDIGAHTRTHVPLAKIAASEVKDQVLGSRRDLEAVVGHPVQWFAYPFGSFDASVLAEVRAAGFVLAVTTNGGTRESSTASLKMPRIHIGRTTTPATVLSCVSAPGACGSGGGD
jgi:peptidoglycan/xylan/chitin deacetylase (PgdA/CDA1 family)